MSAPIVSVVFAPALPITTNSPPIMLSPSASPMRLVLFAPLLSSMSVAPEPTENALPVADPLAPLSVSVPAPTLVAPV